ncbi:peptidase M28 [Glycocaulis alkaliphilus]|uniref:Peptidase M28 n=1 Tax=Glycocaulis alkaliphilus TaxID=1434191 RepID=A0A3T0E829_9PROT|nr:M28 family metallopeptidase [Glycocaulis alkaliphilus]AZU03543.1 peptidase M28 [Glycocaulis alkaliphilus]GGB74320.1 aminopeptidase [Glycocaulis alkaliphilus]
MIRHYLAAAASAALLLSACATTGAAPASQREAAAGDIITPAAIEAHIRFLADDLLEGRDTGTRGYDIAARYVESHFRLLGLEPGASDGSYHEPVPLQNMVADASAARLTIDGEALEHGTDFIISAHATRDQSAVTAEAVFAGYGIVAPGLGFDSYDGIDVEGRIVVVLAGAPGGLPSDVSAHLSNNRTKAEFAAARGASGVIVIMADGLTRFPFSRLAAMAANPRPSMTVAAAASPASIEVSAVVGTAGAERLFAVSGRDFSQIVEAAQAGEPLESFALNATAGMAQATTREPVASANVIGVLPGSDPALSAETVVVTAHLDHIGICQPMADNSICNGALDNASGTAAMLESARALVQGPRPARTVVFIALTAEEKGLLGSAHVAANPTPAMGRMVANINLDMPVMLYEFNDVIAFGAEHSSLGPVASEAVARAGVTLSPDPIPDQSLFVRSDHYNFVREGVPSVFLMTGFSSPDPEDDEGQAFLRFLGGNYHAPGDDLSQPLRFDQGAKFALINYEIIRAVANASETPRWNDDSFFAH